MAYIHVQKIREDAKLPERANPSDAGADVFYCGDENVLLGPGDSCLLGTGLRIATPHGYVTEVKNRSGMASKRSLVVGACIIDSGYEGEVKINLHNIGKVNQTIYPGDKIAQLIVYEVKLVTFEEIEEGDGLYDGTVTLSSRKEAGFGSTGN
jgi:dUTP pyrophosphatase